MVLNGQIYSFRFRYPGLREEIPLGNCLSESTKSVNYLLGLTEKRKNNLLLMIVDIINGELFASKE